ncbi:hypothetical protein [Zwartia vadi]|uniref:hypothetical protein n=1 Tax=Zwartia vadi TaxID=3058168 RepID=UPI0025B38810|nr:hypothetical protein [Zwartia vadi]MDN3987152.1 hypothetical protein [Zwartia vadi]
MMSTPHSLYSITRAPMRRTHTFNPNTEAKNLKGNFPHTQGGATILETLLALLPIILLGSLCIELARGYQVRHLLTLALHEAGRVAAVHQADPGIWQKALDQSLSRLFLPAGRFQNAHIRREHEHAQFKIKFSLPLWQAIELRSTPETIHLQLTYLYRPEQEWLQGILRTLKRHFPHPQSQGIQRLEQQSLSRQAWRQGFIPIVVEHRVLRHRSLVSP